MELVPSPGTGTEHMENPFRQLIVFSFTCPMCGEVHEASFYFTQEAASLEEYLEALHGMAQDWNSVQRILSDAIVETHTQRGDLEEQVDRVARQGLRETPPPAYWIVDESRYTCDDCGAEFPAMRELREHMAAPGACGRQE